MVRLRTTDDLGCEINISPTSYNLKNIKCIQIEKQMNLKINSLDLTSKSKSGNLLKTEIYLHNNNINAHFDTFKTFLEKNKEQDREIEQKANISDIPTKTSELTNDSGFAKAENIPNKTSDLTNDSGFITIADVPTNLSEFTNDSGFLTDVSDKANIDANNFSSVGKSTIAGMNMPSQTFENITVGASQSTYTATTHGYFYVDAVNSGSANAFVRLVNTSAGIATQNQLTSAYGQFSLFLPVLRGQTIQLIYANATINVFKLVYANGAA